MSIWGTTELDKTRRYLVPVARIDLPDQPDLVHLSLYEWLPQFEAWATGPGLCGHSTCQGALPEDAVVTCPQCLEWRPTYAAVLNGQAVRTVPAAQTSSLDSLPAKVREAVRDSGLKQRWIAARLHISEKHLSQLMTGRVEMTPEWAERILGLCGMELVVSVRPRQEGL